MADLKRGDAHLENINTVADGTIRIEGKRIDVIFAWMQLSAAVATTVHVPLPALLAECAVLGKDFEALNRCTEDYRIDLSHLEKGGTPDGTEELYHVCAGLPNCQ